MKAVVVEEYTAIENVRLTDVPKPDISTGQVRVRVQAVGIGFVDGLKIQAEDTNWDAEAKRLKAAVRRARS